MVDFDKPRCVRIISDTIDAIDATLEEHTDVIDYDTVEGMLEGDAELRLDRKAMIGLKEHLEQDCE